MADENTKMNADLSEKADQDTSILKEDNKKSLSKGLYKTFNHRFLKYADKGRNITTYDEIWSKGLPWTWEGMKELNNNNFNLTDITSAIYNTDYCMLTTFRAIVFSKTDTTLYMPVCGCWVEQKANDEIRYIMERFMNVMKKLLIDRIDLLTDDLRKLVEKKTSDDEPCKKEKSQMELLENKSKFYVKLYNYIGGNQQESIIKRLISKIVMETKYDDTFKLANFNKATGYIPFTDGVYSFKEKRLINDTEAYKLLLTRTTGYDYNKVESVSDETYQQCKKFLMQIIPNENILKWLLCRYNRAFQSLVEKLILIYHGAMGNNGKTVLLALINMTLGDELYVKCSKKLLNAESINNAGSANEELMSINGALFVAFSEPSSKKAFDMSILKELSGGDAITGRRLFKGKEQFTAKGLINVACNDIPSIDEADEASFNRIRCIPFTSIFTSKIDKVNEDQHIYLADGNISNNFNEWKYALMKIVLESDEEVETPPEVKAHTKKYRESEDNVRRFVSERVERVYDTEGEVDKSRYIRRVDLWEDFKIWAKDETIKPVKKDFNKSIVGILQDWRKDTDVRGMRIKDCFLGYKNVVDGWGGEVGDDYDP
jgi:P4 family phage/plasmid primase-like protien